MTNREIAASPINKIWDIFASVKLTVVLLLSLAATSIIGTLIPQNEDPAAYFKAFGGYLYRLFDVLGLFNMYYSWWFQMLLVLLTINIIVCSIDRMSANRRILFVKKPSLNLSRYRNIKPKESFEKKQSPENLKETYQKQISRHYRYSRTEATERGFAILGEKGRWTRFGVYTVHFSVILLLIGALIGSIFGFEGFVNIPEGESVRQIRLRNSTQTMQLPFTIRCDDYYESYWENGAPKEFRSSVTILEQGRPVLEKDIVMNDPLRYKGISIYQASRGTLPSNEVVLSFTSKKSGKTYTQETAAGKLVKIPEQLGTFVVKNFVQSYKFKGHEIGETLIGSLTPPDGQPVEVALPLRFPSFDKMRNGEVVITVVEQVQRFYTGLSLNKDPGVWIVYCGFILMIIGCYITFFMSHQQICVELERTGIKTKVFVAGTANKNKTGMQAKMTGFADKLAKLEPGV